MRVTRRDFCQILLAMGASAPAAFPAVAETRDVRRVDSLRVTMRSDHVGLLMRQRASSSNFLRRLIREADILAAIEIASPSVASSGGFSGFPEGSIVVEVPGRIVLVAPIGRVVDSIPMGTTDRPDFQRPGDVLLVHTPLLRLQGAGREETFSTGTML